MKNALICRLYQKIMYVAEFLIPWRQPRVLTGEGALLKLPMVIAQSGVRSVLIVTDRGLMDLGLVSPLLDALQREGIAYCVYDKVVPNPTVANVEEATKLFYEGKCAAIVAFGGGSPMDCAKGVGARIARPKKSIQKMRGVLKIRKKIPTLYAVPTTSGTGSETTLAAVITDAEKNFKFAVNDPVLIPSVAVLDPTLTVGLPPSITAATGMDALCHAVEAYIGRSNTRSTKRNAEEAVRLIAQNLAETYRNGKNVPARAAMQKASYLAGLAFTRAYVGYVHAIAHSLGGKYGIAHGLANAVLLPHVLKAYGKSAEKKLAKLAEVAGVDTAEANQKQKARDFIAWLTRLNEEMHLPAAFEQIREEDLEELSAHAEREANPLYPVPKEMGKEDLKKIYRAVMCPARETATAVGGPNEELL